MKMRSLTGFIVLLASCKLCAAVRALSVSTGTGIYLLMNLAWILEADAATNGSMHDSPTTELNSNGHVDISKKTDPMNVQVAIEKAIDAVGRASDMIEKSSAAVVLANVAVSKLANALETKNFDARSWFEIRNTALSALDISTAAINRANRAVSLANDAMENALYAVETTLDKVSDETVDLLNVVAGANSVNAQANSAIAKVNHATAIERQTIVEIYELAKNYVRMLGNSTSSVDI